MKIIRKETIELSRDEWGVFNNFYDFIHLLSGRVSDVDIVNLLTTISDAMEGLEEYLEEE